MLPCLRIQAFANFRPDREDHYFMPYQAVGRRKINKPFFLFKEKKVSLDRWNEGWRMARYAAWGIVPFI